MVGYYPMAEGSGSMATDMSANQNHLDFGAPKWDVGNMPTRAKGQSWSGTSSLLFNGDTYLMNKTVAGWGAGSAVTVEFWMKTTATAGTILSYATFSDPTQLVISLTDQG